MVCGKCGAERGTRAPTTMHTSTTVTRAYPAYKSSGRCRPRERHGGRGDGTGAVSFGARKQTRVEEKDSARDVVKTDAVGRVARGRGRAAGQRQGLCPGGGKKTGKGGAVVDMRRNENTMMNAAYHIRLWGLTGREGVAPTPVPVLDKIGTAARKSRHRCRDSTRCDGNGQPRLLLPVVQRMLWEHPASRRARTAARRGPGDDTRYIRTPFRVVDCAHTGLTPPAFW